MSDETIRIDLSAISFDGQKYVVTDLNGRRHYFPTDEYEVESFPNYVIVTKKLMNGAAH